MTPHSAIAFRWGQTNDHSYPVGAYPDFETAKAAADAECEYRGGKYGVSVFVGGRAGDVERETHQLVYHAPSMAGEDKPETNPIRDVEHLLGSRVLRMHAQDSYEKIEEYAAKLAAFYKIDRAAQVINPVAEILEDLIEDVLTAQDELKDWYDERDRSYEEEQPERFAARRARILLLEGLRPKLPFSNTP